MNTLRYGYINRIEVDLAGQTVGQILGDANFRATLGFGCNVVAKVDGIVRDSDYVVRTGETIDIETKANEKAAGCHITLTYGATSRIDVEVSEGTTVRSVLTNRSYRAVLGFGDNTVAKVDGVLVNDDLLVTDGMTVVLETRANEKAS